MLLAVVTVAVSLGLVTLMGYWRTGLAFEALWYLTLCALFSAATPIRNLLGSLTTLQRATLTIFGVGLLAAQFVGGGRHTYPLVRWAMFTDVRLDASATIFEGVRQSGVRIRIEPAELVPSLSNGRFSKYPPALPGDTY